jgi:hypothetical protein
VILRHQYQICRRSPSYLVILRHTRRTCFCSCCSLSACTRSSTPTRSVRLRLRTVDRRIQLVRLRHFNPTMRRRHHQSRRLEHTNPSPQRTVCFYLRRAFTRGIDDKRHRLPMRLKPPPRKLLQIVRARNQPLTGEHISPKILCHLRRNFVLKKTCIDRSRARPHMARNDEVVMNPRNMVVAHGISHHRRNMRAKRTLQVLELDDRNLRTTRRLERRGVLERSNLPRRHCSLRTSRNNQHKSQHQDETIHGNHSSGRLLPFKQPFRNLYRTESAFATKVPPRKLHSAKGAFDTSMGRSPMNTIPNITRAESPAYPSSFALPIASKGAHASFQSTPSPLTPTIKWNQAPTVRRKPDCTI